MISPIQIEEVTKRLVATYDPLTVYLFGSYAWGTPNEDSDLDLLVVIETSDEKRHKRTYAGYHALWGMMIPKDLLVYTKAEFELAATDESRLPYMVKRYGKTLYAQP